MMGRAIQAGPFEAVQDCQDEKGHILVKCASMQAPMQRKLTGPEPLALYSNPFMLLRCCFEVPGNSETSLRPATCWKQHTPLCHRRPRRPTTNPNHPNEHCLYMVRVHQ